MTTYEPKAGHYLHSSCSDATVYEIIGSGKDDNGAPTIDVRVLDLNEVIHFGDDDDVTATSPLTVAELPEGVHAILRGMQWRLTDPALIDGDMVWIVVNGSVGGCYRCGNLFTVHASPGGRDPVRMVRPVNP